MSARNKEPHEKYCLECGALIHAAAPICPLCGGSQLDTLERSKKHCHECGAILRGRAVVCPQCGVEQGDYVSSAGKAANNRVAAGVCGILLGAMGVHKFILGYTWSGITMVLISIVGVCCYGWMAMHIVGIIEGILYLSMSDRDFQSIHGKRLRPWF
jgi:RNA polymerase subunit RPABC4/transcription elongation factor Spt4/TM2 domain-containing membrane protein YozV